MAWSDITPTGGNSWTDESTPSTEYIQLEPTGFGYMPFGDPSTVEKPIRIHMRGFGDPKTTWTEYSET